MTGKLKKLALCLSLAAVAALASMLFSLAVNAQTFSGSFERTDWQGGRENLYKSGRWCAELRGDRIDITVQYQKQEHLLCDVGDAGDVGDVVVGDVVYICHGLPGTQWAWDNRGALSDWHDSIRYTGIPVKPAPSDSYSDRVGFLQDGFSGYLWSGKTRMNLRVNSPGRVVFSSAPVSDATGC